jgi:hypothetical protein
LRSQLAVFKPYLTKEPAMTASKSPVHRFSTMIEKDVHPVIAFARSGFFMLLEERTRKGGLVLSPSQKVFTFGTVARLTRSDDNRGLPKGVRHVQFRLELDDPREGFRTASEVTRVTDNRPILYGGVGPYMTDVIVSAYFNRGYLAELKQFELELAAPARATDARRRAAGPTKKP